MIELKLTLIEKIAMTDPKKNHLKLKAIKNAKRLFAQIDFNAELLPIESAFKLKELLIFLKGTQLTNEESKLVEELVA
ncbi:MAG: hypothetical protein HOF75_02665 [Flavobacteriaceae bacterium]|jgi:hypothetical protein|nr:hypothetical protein [Flavobacteriaceae bacterium]MBT3918802.1 hypothetical protein [Flavobacteriaceae bacterium]MBT6706126.1 hypothetical protein [Flavobacteriaceae bacterium]MBT7241973.1 hypothetical protein [Flavobacteriaceae bacterium]|tara:strand:+ start:91 stop:324 length:234 start_codon:yes stop_codon:yes gene_type:complete